MLAVQLVGRALGGPWDGRHGWRREKPSASGTECDMNTLDMPLYVITTELSLIVDNATTHHDTACES